MPGSYCWRSICVDYAKPWARSDLDQKIRIQQNGRIAFKVKNYAKPRKFQMTIFSGEIIILNKFIEQEYAKLDISEGIYVLSVTGFWTEEGDISYLFPLEITRRTIS
jgi:hypothetical protein